MSHNVKELVEKIGAKLQHAVDNSCFVKNLHPCGNCSDPGLPTGVNDNTDIANIPDDPLAPAPQTSPLGQVIDHALYRKWSNELSITTQSEGLESLIKTVGRLEKRLETVAKQVEKIAKK